MGMFTFFLISLFSLLKAEGDSSHNGNLISNLSFKSTKSDAIVTAYLRQSVNAKSINLMESKDGEPDNFTIKESIESDVDWDSEKNRFTYSIDKSQLSEDQFYAIQILDQNDKWSHSEPFVYQDGNFVFSRNAKSGSSKAIGIVALVLSAVALLLI